MLSNCSQISAKNIWLLFWIAAISFVFTLNLSHVGEEGVYTISSFEMWYDQHYLYPLLYGSNYGRPPFLNWMIILLTKVVGWEHMLLASRLIAAASTVGIGLVLAWLTQNIFCDKKLAAFSALAYLTTDALFYHGWLAYSDPLFSFCVFVAIACLIVACERQSFFLLFVAMVALVAAFLTKALTAYVFYISAVVLLLFSNRRKFLLHPVSVVLHLAVLGVPWFWSVFTNNANGGGLLRDIWYWGWQAGQNTRAINYFIQLFTFPSEIFVKLFPVSVVALYYCWRSYSGPRDEDKNILRFLMLFVVINFFPYWIGAKHATRYILPLYPFVALWGSYIIWRVGIGAMRVTIIWFIAAIVIKYLSVFFWWPYYQTDYRGSYVQTAQDIVLKIGNYPLYTYDPGATEHSVFDNVNVLRYPLSPTKRVGLRPAKENNYFILGTDKDLDLGAIAKEYTLGKQQKKLYLFCYGKECKKIKKHSRKK